MEKKKKKRKKKEEVKKQTQNQRGSTLEHMFAVNEKSFMDNFLLISSRFYNKLVEVYLQYIG